MRTLGRFYAFHVLFLPALLLMLVVLHLVMVVRQGIASVLLRALPSRRKRLESAHARVRWCIGDSFTGLRGIAGTVALMAGVLQRTVEHIIKYRSALEEVSMRIVTSLLAYLILVPAAGAAQEAPDSLPPGVTSAMIAEGEALFTGAAVCMACHGPDGKGLTAPDLTDDEWAHSDGSYEAIVEQIMIGVSADKSESGIPMMPKGGSAITDEQVRAVAAYVWSLSRGS